MVQDAPTGHHAAQLNNDCGKVCAVDFLRVLRRLRECKTRPLQWRAVLLDRTASFILYTFEWLRNTCTALIAIGLSQYTGTARNLPGLHQIFDHEEKLLGTFDGKCGHNHAAAPLHRLADDRGQFRLWDRPWGAPRLP